MTNRKLETLTVGGGCFWCIEAIFQQIEGVQNVISGYSGGTVPGTPTYREVSSGRTGHTEVVQMNFNPNSITCEELLFIFMTSHDPTTSNQKGSGLGSQYRSVVYYHSDEQKKSAEKLIMEMAVLFNKPMNTELSPRGVFYPAEDYHQDYFNQNSDTHYCTAVITPKLETLRKRHGDKLYQKKTND